MILGVNLGYHSKKLYPLINDQYTVRPDEAFRILFSATLGIRILGIRIFV
jgi:hypothetical protein